MTTTSNYIEETAGYLQDTVGLYPETIRAVLAIAGYTEEAINALVFYFTGYRDLGQLIEAETEDD